MTTKELAGILGEENRRMFKELTGIDYEPGEYASIVVDTFLRGPCFCGVLKKQNCSCRDFLPWITLQDPTASPSTGHAAVGWVIDNDPANNDDDAPLVIAMGINYGQGDWYLKNRGKLFDKTQMRDRLDRASQAIPQSCSSICPIYPLPNKFRLVVGNFFPWITNLAWSKLSLNSIQEALFIHCYGLPDPSASLESLLTRLGTNVSHLIFHGANNAVPFMGANFVRQHLRSYRKKLLKLHVMFCDNLARPGLPIANSVGLCP